MSRIFSPKMPTPPPVQPLPEPPELTDEEKAEIARKERMRDLKRKGRKSTILTGPMGVEEEAEIGKKTLLGE